MFRLPLAFAAILFQIAAACAMETPAMKGRVSDYAGVLTPAQIENIAAKSKEVEDRTTAQIAFLTVPVLPEEGIEAFSNQIFNDWRLGASGKDNGVLVLIAPTVRKIRIEVGRGLEAAIPDSVARRIINERFVPKAKAGDYASGAAAVVETLAGYVGKEISEDPTMGPNVPNPPSEHVGLVVMLLVIGAAGLVALASVGEWSRKPKPTRWPARSTDPSDRSPAPAPVMSQREKAAQLQAAQRKARSSSRGSSGSAYRPAAPSRSPEPSIGFSPASSDSWTSPSPSSSNDSFSGGGGGSDGGGASGDW